MIFGVVVVGPLPGPFDLRRMPWHHFCMLQWYQNIARIQNFIFAMLRLEIASDNATTDPLYLEYS